MKIFIFHITFCCFFSQLALADESNTVISDVIAAINSEKKEINSNQLILLDFTTKITRKANSEANQDNWTHSGKLAIKLNGNYQPALIKYESAVPCKTSSAESLGSNVNHGISKYENGAWKIFEDFYEHGNFKYPVKKLTLSNPGYENCGNATKTITELNPLRYILSNDATLIRMRGFNDVGIKGILYDINNNRPTNFLLSASQESPRVVKLKCEDPRLKMSQVISLDLAKGCIPVKYDYVGDTSEPERSFEKWTSSGHTFCDGFGWIPALIEGELKEGETRRQFKTVVNSVSLINEEAAQSIFKQEVGAGWHVEDKVTGQIFEVGHSPKDVIDQTYKSGK